MTESTPPMDLNPPGNRIEMEPAIEILEGETVLAVYRDLLALGEAAFDGFSDSYLLERLPLVNGRALVTARDRAGRLIGFKLGYQRGSTLFYSWLGGVHPEVRRQGVAQRAEQVDDRRPYDHAFAARVAARVAEAVVRRWRVAVTPAHEVRQMVRAAVMAGLPDGAGSRAIRERALDADVTATRVYDGLYGRSAVGLRAEDRAILRRLRDHEARTRASIGHLGEDVRRQCDEAVALLDRLIGAGSP